MNVTFKLAHFRSSDVFCNVLFFLINLFLFGRQHFGQLTKVTKADTRKMKFLPIYVSREIRLFTESDLLKI